MLSNLPPNVTNKMIEDAQEQEICRYPEWYVITNKGKIVGTVFGGNEQDALISVEQSPDFDKYKALTVRKKLDLSECEE